MRRWREVDLRSDSWIQVGATFYYGMRQGCPGPLLMFLQAPRQLPYASHLYSRATCASIRVEPRRIVQLSNGDAPGTLPRSSHLAGRV